MPRKIASTKKAKPSSENGIPKMGPAKAMNVGQSRPSSKDRTVPETAPTAKSMAVPWAQVRARARLASSPRRIQRSSAMTMSSGIAMPTTENRMWNPSEIAICDRAARRFVTA
jgi:hypothetical protein